MIDILVLRFTRSDFKLCGLSRCCNHCILELRRSGIVNKVAYSTHAGTIVKENLREMPLVHMSRGWRIIGTLEKESEKQTTF